MSDSAKLATLLEEANELRWEHGLGEYGDSPAELHQTLLRVRANLDRLERILADVMRLYTRAEGLQADRQAAYDDAWNKAAQSAGLGHSFDDPAPKERYARYADKVVKEQVNLRIANKVSREVRVVLDIVRLYHRGLDSLRRDIELRIRILTFEVSLER